MPVTRILSPRKVTIFPFTLRVSVVPVGSKIASLALPSGSVKDYSLLIPFSLADQGIEDLHDHLSAYRLMHDYLDIKNATIYALKLTGTIYTDQPDDVFDFLVEKCWPKFLATTEMNTVPSSEDIVKTLVSNTQTNIVIDLDWTDIQSRISEYTKLLAMKRGYEDVFIYPAIFNETFTSLSVYVKPIGELKDTGKTSTRELYIPESPAPQEGSDIPPDTTATAEE